MDEIQARAFRTAARGVIVNCNESKRGAKANVIPEIGRIAEAFARSRVQAPGTKMPVNAALAKRVANRRLEIEAAAFGDGVALATEAGAKATAGSTSVPEAAAKVGVPDIFDSLISM